ncbi:MAG: CTP synthase [Pseudomonadaceae bacterium]|nr:CTP synthase [Pseudomonadaceae bacterium]
MKKLGQTHYIFVTGGVMSALGKGLTASALGAILQARGFSVVQQKLDPYLNIDPGTMSPFQHGEVYVTDDGCETDLDLGHYERFTGVPTSRSSNITAGQVYWDILHKERKGDYLGKTVQVVPHVTNEIKAFIGRMEGQADFSIVEIGGTVGDIESMAFIEAIRQYARETGRRRSCFMHLAFAPYLKAVGEVKTKPTQNAVRELLEAGVQADVVVVRSEVEVERSDLEKIAMFAGLPASHVVNCPDSDTIYRVPVTLHNHGLDDAILSHFDIKAKAPDMAAWQHVSSLVAHPPREVTIAVVGKYVQLGDSYISLNEALLHGGFAHDAKVNILFVDSETLESMGDDEVAAILAPADGILVPGGFGARGAEGKIRAIRYARENKVPYFGICFGMQLAAIEFARHVAGLTGASSSEFDADRGAGAHTIINLMTEWHAGDAKLKRGKDDDLGGTMRLGAYPCKLAKGTLAGKAYGSSSIAERHRHRYEFNPAYRAILEKAGLVFSGTSPTDPDLVEIIELPTKTHPSFFACQYHPEFKSRPLAPHPLFAAFAKAALAYVEEKSVRKAA